MAETRGCIKLEMDDSKFSSFVPVIGMYIAGISLVCLLAMLYDICSAVRHKKIWLPCKLFSMNSVTLTLLAVAAKLPVDLTTPMPSGLDQFSKLTGNGLICVSMGFLMPSLGLKSNHDSMTNMLALSVFVLTLVVNTCLQIRTGVIFLFITEHIIVMCCLLAMLFPLLICIVHMTTEKDFALDHDKDLLREGKGSMLERLELAYLYGFNHDPQFVISKETYANSSVSGFCIICSVVLMQAAIRNLSLKFCGGSSDYGWSIWVIVLAQTLAVLVGSSATVFRSWAFRDHGRMIGSDKKAHPSILDTFIDHVVRLQMKCGKIGFMIFVLANPILIILGWLCILIGFVAIGFLSLVILAEAMFRMASTYLKQQEEIVVTNSEKIIVDGGGMSLTDWGLLESVKDMQRWMMVIKSQPMKALADLLLETQPSQPFHTMRAPQNFLLNDTLEVSSFSLVALVYITKFSLPSQFSGPIIQAYGEVMEIIYFIDARMRSRSSMNKLEIRHAKALWVICSEPHTGDWEEFQFRRVHTKLQRDCYNRTLISMRMFINAGYCRSTEHGLSDFIKQLFVDMVCIFLTQLPRAVYKEVIQSPAEGFYESVKTSLEILLKTEWLDTHMLSSGAPIKWSFPWELGACDLRTFPFESHEQEHLGANIPSYNTSPEHDNNVIVEVEP